MDAAPPPCPQQVALLGISRAREAPVLLECRDEQRLRGVRSELLLRLGRRVFFEVRDDTRVKTLVVRVETASALLLRGG